MERYWEEKLKDCEDTLKEHDAKLDTLIKSDAVHSTQIEALCKKLDSLTTSIWGLIIVMIGGFVTFFFTAMGK